jgi:transcriptional regulator with XRE-family HTH domain
VKNSEDLRKVLSQNIRIAREALHITQAKLAEYSDISLPYMTDIEHCKTWVSDKTLINIARSLNLEAYELLVPPESKIPQQGKDHTELLRQIAGLVNEKKLEMKKKTMPKWRSCYSKSSNFFQNNTTII